MSDTDHIFAFSISELVYLTTGENSEASAHIGTLLGLGAVAQHTGYAFAGASSLIARGLATSDGTLITPISVAALMQTAICHPASAQWVTIPTKPLERPHVLVTHRHDLHALLTPGAMGTWYLSATPNPDAAQPLFDLALTTLLAEENLTTDKVTIHNETFTPVPARLQA